MSSRALRKLHGGTDIVIPGSVQDSAGDGTHVDGEEEVSDPEIDNPPELCKRGNRKKNRNNYSNPFDLVCVHSRPVIFLLLIEIRIFDLKKNYV